MKAMPKPLSIILLIIGVAIVIVAALYGIELFTDWFAEQINEVFGW